jgi:hypothetical protein
MLAPGWARKPPVAQYRFPQAMKELLWRLFQQNRGSNNLARVNEGRALQELARQFPGEDLPILQQVKALFSRWASLEKKGKQVAAIVAASAELAAAEADVQQAQQCTAAAAAGADSEVEEEEGEDDLLAFGGASEDEEEAADMAATQRQDGRPRRGKAVASLVSMRKWLQVG